MPKFTRDNDGNVIDPPVIAAHEQLMAAALASGDPDDIRIAQEDYDEARNARIERLEGTEKESPEGLLQQPADSAANQDARNNGLDAPQTTTEDGDTQSAPQTTQESVPQGTAEETTKNNDGVASDPQDSWKGQAH